MKCASKQLTNSYLSLHLNKCTTLCMYMYVNYTITQYFKTENNKLSNDKKNNDNHSWHNCLSEKFESTLSWLLYDMILRYWWIYYIKGWLL